MEDCRPNGKHRRLDAVYAGCRQTSCRMSETSNKRLRYDPMTGAYIIPADFGVLHYVVELLTPERCRPITRLVDERDALVKLKSERSQTLNELMELLKSETLWDREKETFDRNPTLDLPDLLRELESRAATLLKADLRSRFLWDRSYYPGHEFYELWVHDATESSSKLLAAQLRLDAVFRRLHELYTYYTRDRRLGTDSRHPPTRAESNGCSGKPTPSGPQPNVAPSNSAPSRLQQSRMFVAGAGTMIDIVAVQTFCPAGAGRCLWSCCLNGAAFS